MATPQEPLPRVTPADPVATHSLANLNATASGTASSSAVPTPPPASADRYVLGEEIACGGMGVVYRATDTTFGREVAVKVLQDKFGSGSAAARRFADEARITGQLQHPAIPPVHDLGTLPDGRPFLAMKLIKGNTLDARLKARRSPGDDRGRFVAVFEHVCQALAFAHAHNVIHRDLKPANVMVGSFGEVQVMDWGLAKVLGTRTVEADAPDKTRAETEIRSLRESDGEFTQAGSILGTPAFMPPEQAIGAIDRVDARSDVFGLGGILCVLLTGRAPFAGDTAERIRQAAAQGKVTEAFARLDACGADPELIALCKRCLAPEKEDRPTDAGEVARTVAELRVAAEERARRAEGERVAAEARATERRKRRRLAGAAAVVLAVALVGGLAAVLLVQRRANADLTAKNQELADEQAKAEARFALAQKAIAKLHTGVSEDMLLKSDQFKELRTQLLKQAADFYGDLEKLLEGQTDAKSRRLLTEGYFQLAELTAQVGTFPEALTLHSKALALRRELAAMAGADVETRLEVARSLGAMGKLSLGNDTEEAFRAFAEQLSVAAALETESPTQAVQVVLAQSLINNGSALWMMGKSAEALAASEKAVAIQRELAKANPTATEIQYELAKSLNWSENLLWESGRWAEDLATLENARIILEMLVADNPAVSRFRYQLAMTHNSIGATLFQEGKPAESLVAVEKSRAKSQELVDTHPAVSELQYGLALNHINLCRALAELGKPVEAMAAIQKAPAFWQKLTAAYPTAIMPQYYLAMCHNDTGEVLAQIGKSGEALTSHEKARALLVKPAEAKQAFHWVQSELARSLDKTGLLLSSGKPAEALAACREALAIRQKLSDAQPGLAWLRWELAGSLAGLGTVQRRAGQSADAIASFRHAIGLVEHLPELTPRNHFSLSCCHAQLAAIAAEAGSGMTAEQGMAEAERAMAALRQAIATGYSGIAPLRSDASLDALRSREDFQKLVKELEEKASKAQAV